MQLRKLVTAWWWRDPQGGQPSPNSNGCHPGGPGGGTQGRTASSRAKGGAFTERSGTCQSSPCSECGCLRDLWEACLWAVGPCLLLPQGTPTSLARPSHTLLCYCNSLDGLSSPPPTSLKRPRPACPYPSQAEPRAWCTSDTQDR